ncbi:pilus assembly protein TadG-related protein [Celeribacter sp.]|uniref:pilus assembly protein TadG-related protein n=1 Tax=Celeribacter sp. TaxID=1890673 RepID=UPI003A906D0A
MEKSKKASFGTTNTSDLSVRTNAKKSIGEIWRENMRNEDGSLAIFGLFTFVIILVLGGIGVDIVRHEQLRSELQGTLDRAVLAAANLDNSLDPEEVVNDYFRKAGLKQYLSDVRTEMTPTGRRITAEVDAVVPTYFMKFASIDRLDLNSYATAEQGMTDLEVSLVLDVSNSMNDMGRLTKLHNAAWDFTDIVFKNSASANVSMNVVPYATQVNAGATLLSKLDIDDAHHDAHCINFEGSDFNNTHLQFAGNDDGRRYEQTMVIDPWYQNRSSSGLTLPVCNPDPDNEILAFSNNEAAIKSMVSSIQADGNTSIDIGVKWGAALLDPANSKLGGNTGYPLEKSGGNLKVMVVMTDGVNTDQFHMPDPYREGKSDIYIYNGKTSMPARYRTCNYYSCYYTNGYYVPETGDYRSTPYGGSSAELMDWKDVWKKYTIDGHAYRRYKASGNSSDYYDWMDATHTAVNNSTKNNRMLAVCDAAKDAGVLIFTIGFEVDGTNADTVMRECASSDSHYYDVDGLELNDAFSAIATKVTELRLTQ